MLNRTTILLALLVTCPGTPLAAQELSEQPITRYVMDLRVALPKVPANDALAHPYGLTATDMPGLGIGIEGGAHVYPLRWKKITFGVGVSGVYGGAHASPVTHSDGTVTGKIVSARFSALALQISFNFGSAAGWSYLSGGIATARLELRTPDTPATTVFPRRKTINYGGGGRWFLRDRMAVTFDVRFYAMNPVAESSNTPPSPRLRMLVVSIGISLR